MPQDAILFCESTVGHPLSQVLPHCDASALSPGFFSWCEVACLPCASLGDPPKATTPRPYVCLPPQPLPPFPPPSSDDNIAFTPGLPPRTRSRFSPRLNLQYFAPSSFFFFFPFLHEAFFPRAGYGFVAPPQNTSFDPPVRLPPP